MARDPVCGSQDDISFPAFSVSQTSLGGHQGFGLADSLIFFRCSCDRMSSWRFRKTLVRVTIGRISLGAFSGFRCSSSVFVTQALKKMELVRLENNQFPLDLRSL